MNIYSKKYIKYKVINSERKSIVAREKYSLRYEKDRITRSLPGTLGIMCFQKIEQAEEFKEHISSNVVDFPEQENPIIIRVFPTGKLIKTNIVSCGPSPLTLDKFYSVINRKFIKKNLESMLSYMFELRDGTICYESVLCLD